jgi:hypothetical protein
MGTFTPHKGTHCFILVSERNDTPITWEYSPHTWAYTSFHLKRHTHIMGILTPHRGTQLSISVSEWNDTPISWAHPTHGLSHRTNHLVCVLKDVSQSCNHQHEKGYPAYNPSNIHPRYSYSDYDSNRLQGHMRTYNFFSWG